MADGCSHWPFQPSAISHQPFSASPDDSEVAVGWLTVRVADDLAAVDGGLGDLVDDCRAGLLYLDLAPGDLVDLRDVAACLAIRRGPLAVVVPRGRARAV